MARATIAIFCMAEDGHFKLIRPLIFDLARSGFAVHVFTHRRYAAEIKGTGAHFVDLFTKYPLEQADTESIPIPSRYVSYAATHIEAVMDELKRLRPDLILYETFSVIARLAGRLLDIPFVNVSPGHNLDPARFLAMLKDDPRVATSERCHRAVETLRVRYGVSDASPFSYMTGLSPHLNICCEPPEFLSAEERKTFAPLAFYGCIPSEEDAPRPDDAGADFLSARPSSLRLYVAFGTVALRYYADAALGVFEAISDCLADMPDVRALISLGGATIEDDRLRRIERSNVKIVGYVDQWSVLQKTDLFLTHHGVNSTHEAILRRVPMLSYPFFMDQPSLAEKCQALGIAIPLASAPRGPVEAEDIRAALKAFIERKEAIAARLDEARSWELAVMAGRPAVVERIAGLASATRRGP